MQCDRVINPIPNEILYFYGEWDKMNFERLKSVFGDRIMFYEGLPNFDMLRKRVEKRKVIVLDDLMMESKQSIDSVAQLFTRMAHHLNFSIIMTVQNLFEKIFERFH